MPRPSPSGLRHSTPAGPDHLGDLADTFANPGDLRFRTFVPPRLPSGAPLIVVLHGCTQSAAGYDHAAGWSALATARGFALLFPEQVRANNPNLCFNWFEASDTRRGHGEAASIAGAVAAMVAAHKLDPTRVFVTGLSAGGAMTGVMLATYPDIFAGGAIIAGLPYGVAHGVGPALATMKHPLVVAGPVLGDKVRAASSFAGPWPVVSVWHGGDDRTVSRLNGLAVAAQWADVHGAVAEEGDGRTVWRNASGVAVVEFTEIAGMGHGTPIDSAEGGVAAPFMLDVGVASSAHILAFWGIGAPSRPRAKAPPRPVSQASPVRAAPARPHADRLAAAAARPAVTARPGATRPADRAAGAHGRAAKPKLDIGKVIGDALRTAGLMK